MAYFNPPLQSYFDPMMLAQARNNLMMPSMPQMPQMPGMGMQQPPLTAPQNPGLSQQSQDLPEESPVSRGIASGIGAARQSIDIDQRQHDRLMGLALAKMFGGMGRSPDGSVLGGLNQGLSSGIDSYMNERANLAKLNAMELERQDALTKELQRQKERQEMMVLRRQALEGRSSEIGPRGTSSKNPYYGLPPEGKLMMQQHEIDEGFLPGSNRTVTLTPEQQREYSELNALRMQKNTTDSDTRKRAIFAENLVKAIKNTDIDDLTRYSGPAGQAKLKKEQVKDLMGNPSEEYLRHKEALTAVQIEAKELRQALGESITPAMAEQLQHLTNPTGFFTSPKTAKRQIQKTRDLIQKQMDTFRSRLKRPSANEYNDPYDDENDILRQRNQQFIQNSASPQSMSDEELLRIVGQ